MAINRAEQEWPEGVAIEIDVLQSELVDNQLGGQYDGVPNTDRPVLFDGGSSKEIRKA